MALRLIITLFVNMAIFTLAMFFLFTKHINKPVKLGFIISCVGLLLWQTLLVFSDISTSYYSLINRFVFIGPLLGVLGFNLFINSYIYQNKKFKKNNTNILLLYLPIIVGLIISPTNLVVRDVIPRYSSAGSLEGYSIVRGELYILYTLLLIFYTVYALMRLARAATKKDVSLNEKAAIRIIVLGIGAAITVGITTNVIIPTFNPNSASSAFGPIAVVLFTASMFYSTNQRKLLYVRYAAYKGIAYYLSLAILAFSLTTLLLIITQRFSTLQDDYLLNLILNATVITVAVIVFPFLKGIFDRVFRKVFFREYIDIQEALRNLNDKITGSVKVDSIVQTVENILEKNLKSSFVKIKLLMHEQKYEDHENRDLLELNKVLSDANETLTIVEELDPSSSKAIRLAHQHRVSIASRLHVANDNLGYLYIGEKLNSSYFNADEIKFISILSDQVSIALQNALRFEEIANFNVTLQKKIDDATRELKRSNDKLQALDTAKDEFISMASHQLRTPLTSVKGYVSMVLEGDAGQITDQQRQLLQQAFVSSQRMVYLIADLLNVSRLRTGKFIIEAKPTYLPDVVQSELDQLADTAAARGLELVFTKPVKFPLLMLDETKIRQVIMNFTDNAIYYTPTGGRIEIILSESPRAIELTVNDNGIGVPKKEQHHLFTKFYRAGNAKKARPDGTGLGLFMAKKVIVSQGGAVIFRSQEGKGSTFGFTFPKEKLKVGAPPYT